MASDISDTDLKVCQDVMEDSWIISKERNVKNDSQRRGEIHTKKIKKWFNFKTELKWINIIFITLLHVATLYSFLTFGFFRDLRTFLWIFFMGSLSAFGITAGVHRLWTHRAYEAKLPLRVILLICYAIAGQNRLYDWVRDHRIHHKYVDTDGDPHNSTRGFFFSHVGWLMMKKHPEVIRRGRHVDMSDILADPVVAFGEKYFRILKIVFCFALPTLIPVYVWNETWTRAFVSQIFIRYALVLNFTWSVNSAAHIWGSKPYDAYINPVENRLVAFLSHGEGWHNYHHVFPWDYKAAELGDYRLNVTTMFIDFFAKIGWAYNLKQPSKQLVKTIMMKRGDGSHFSQDAVAYHDSKNKKQTIQNIVSIN